MNSLSIIKTKFRIIVFKNGFRTTEMYYQTYIINTLFYNKLWNMSLWINVILTNIFRKTIGYSNLQ